VSSQDGSDRRRVAVDSMKRLDVRRGRRTRAGEGLLLGLVGGALWGRSAIRGCFEPGSYCIEPGRAAVVGGALGGLVGLVAGAAITTDKWESVPPGHRVSVTPLVAPRTIGGQMTIRF